MHLRVSHDWNGRTERSGRREMLEMLIDFRVSVGYETESIPRLVETSPNNRLWGIGLNSDDAVGNEYKWGEKKLGKALERISERLRKTLPRFDRSRSIGIQALHGGAGLPEFSNSGAEPRFRCWQRNFGSCADPSAARDHEQHPRQVKLPQQEHSNCHIQAV